jgi:putative ABC transport system permease protein
MFKNYISVAFRNLIKNKLYSAINIVGLAVGLAACVMIALFVRDEFSYDKHWAKSDALYRVNTTFSIPGREPMVTTRAPGPAKQAFQAYFPEDVVAATRVRSLFPVLRIGDKVASERIYWTDSETADLFDFNVIAGDMKEALADKASIAIDRSFAERYFGDEDPLGKVFTISMYDIARDYKVAAVYEDLPENTVLNMQAMVKIDEADFEGQPWEFDQWYSTNAYLYFELKAGVSIDAVRQATAAFLDQAIDIDPSAGAFSKASDFMSMHLQPITDIQLNSQGRNGSEMKPTGSMTNVIVFIAIAILILLIACINFMNLATAKSTQRAREVALRKVLGAHRGQLIAQFLGESILIALLGLVLGIVLVEMAVGPFGDFVGKELALNYADGVTVSLLVGLVLFVGAIGGFYPALVLSGFLPAKVLKANKSAETSGSAALRNILVVVQFAISIGLIIATAAVYGQRLYATSMDPGFDKENVLVIQNLGRADVQDKQDTLLQRVLTLPGVQMAALSGDTPANGNSSNSNITREGDDPNQSMLIGRQVVDHGFFDVYDIEVVAGRLYDRARETDGLPTTDGVPEDQELAGTVVINEAAVRRIGYASAEDAIGKRVSLGVSQDREATMEIIGVIADLQFQSLREPMRPEMFLLSRTYVSALSIKFDGNGSDLVSKIEGIWGEMAPSVPFRYEFIDERLAEEFEREESQSILLAIFAGLAVVIACLGLYGLASFAAERRTKEIGIRKVMGASVLDIVRLLIWQFSKPVLIANFIAWPIVVYAVMQWLENFPYRLDAWWLGVFCVAAGMIALSIAWATVGGNAAKVARSNPIKALRYE